jgi:hypothetical protein
MNLSHPVALSGKKQNSLARSGLAGIYVRHQADVPDPAYVNLLGHLKPGPFPASHVQGIAGTNPIKAAAYTNPASEV